MDTTTIIRIVAGLLAIFVALPIFVIPYWKIFSNVLLLIIAIALIAIAVKPLRYPHPAQAQTQTQAQPAAAAPYPLYIEPGIQTLRSPDGTTQVYGRVVVDMQNGKVWGFPTTAMTVYPQDVSSPKPPVSHPFLLGTFAFEDTQK